MDAVDLDHFVRRVFTRDNPDRRAWNAERRGEEFNHRSIGFAVDGRRRDFQFPLLADFSRQAGSTRPRMHFDAYPHRPILPTRTHHYRV